MTMQGSAIRQSPGLVNFVTAIAYHFCIALPAAFTQPEDHLLAEPCRYVATAVISARTRARGHFLRIRLVRNSDSNVAACACGRVKWSTPLLSAVLSLA